MSRINNTSEVIIAMTKYFQYDCRRINHFIKVYGFAKTIGEMEELDEEAQEILEIAAITHDIGIKNSEIKYNSSAGNYQEIEGPEEAKKLLENLGISHSIIDRVCWLIAHHHTYSNIDKLDYQILVEADFIVNIFEDSVSDTAIKNIENNIFKTSTGKMLLGNLYKNGD